MSEEPTAKLWGILLQAMWKTEKIGYGIAAISIICCNFAPSKTQNDMLDKNTKIYVAGHRGLVGSAIWNNLKARGYNNLIGRTHRELDLTDEVAVRTFFDEEQPEAVVLAAAAGGDGLDAGPGRPHRRRDPGGVPGISAGPPGHPGAGGFP